MSDGKEVEDANEKTEKETYGKKEGEVVPEIAGSSLGEKRKRSLRFQLPEPASSEESFTSALSFNMVADAKVSNEEGVQPISVLKKYVLVPVSSYQPRTVSMNPCFTSEVLELSYSSNQASDMALPNNSSSRQLCEIVMNSPKPSDDDMNLIHATYLRKLDGVREAIRNGADVNTFRDRQTPLLIATEIGDDRMVAYLLTVRDINPNFQNVFGETALRVAVRNAFDKIVKLLLYHNADVNIPDHFGKTPLYGALFYQRPKMAKLLLAYGADFEVQDCFGERPMYTAAVKKPNVECLKVLFKVGAQADYVNATGVSLLSRAILNRTDFNVIEMLVKRGASVNSRDINTGKTPLHFAATTNDLEVTKFLVQKKADVNVKTAYKFTPYDEAIFHKSLEVAEFLLNYTINANTKALHNLQEQRLGLKKDIRNSIT